MAEKANVTGIRLDYLMKVLNELFLSAELESALGAPVEKHLALLVENGNFTFRTVSPFDEPGKKFTREDEDKARNIIKRIIITNYPGMGDLPGVR